MDWTGGARRRFAPGRANATVQKQKAHFAKARAALHATPSSNHTFRPAFLQRAAGSKTVGRIPISNDTRASHVASPTAIGIGHGTSQERSGRRWRGPISEHVSAKRRKTQNRSQSPIYISSQESSTPSPPAGLTTQRGSGSARDTGAPPATEAHSMTEDERLLLANRRRLLARTDWLGLAATRPVQMKFASSHDKDRIGKRRKVASLTSRKGKPAGQRLLTPLFEDHPNQRGVMMSGAIQPDDIRVKIGTDALVSQTQHSRRSNTPVVRSARQPSTEFGPLSEESMLLGADGDTFEETRSWYRAEPTTEADVYDAQSLAALAGSQMTRNMGQQRVPARADMSYPPADVEINQQYMAHQYDEAMSQRTDISRSLPKSIGSPGWYEWHMSNRESTTSPRRPEHCRTESSASGHNMHENSQVPNTPHAQSSLEDDERWKRMMNIQQYYSSHTSTAAVKSSSSHFTRSENSKRAVTEALYERHNGQYQSMSTPKGAGTQASMLRGAIETVGRHRLPSKSTSLESPSASLQQITNLAELVAPPALQAEEDDDDAIWREFIIGSQGSSSAVEHRFGQHDAAEENAAPMGESSSWPVSGLGTSNRSTLGDTLVGTRV